MGTYYSKEQLAEIRRVGLKDYLAAFEPGELVDKGRGLFSTREHDSVIIYADGWHRFSTGESGRNAMDYLTVVRGYDFMDAANAVASATSLPVSPQKRSAPVHNSPPAPVREINKEEGSEERRVSLPKRNPAGYENAVNYLTGRGIDKGLVWRFIKSRDIYGGVYFDKEKGEERECVVFLGKDKKGEVRLATMRFIDKAEHGSKTAFGSDRSYGFFIPARASDAPLMVYESPIDLLSDLTFGKIKYGKSISDRLEKFHHLSLSGLSAKAIEQTVRDYNVSEIICRLDADAAGESMYEKILELYGEEISVSYALYHDGGKDVNEELQNFIMSEKESSTHGGIPAPYIPANTGIGHIAKPKSEDFEMEM